MGLGVWHKVAISIPVIAILLSGLEKIPETFLRSTGLISFNPDYYHPTDNRPFFEGWYFKLALPNIGNTSYSSSTGRTDKNDKQTLAEEGSSSSPVIAMAIVPGVFLAKHDNANNDNDQEKYHESQHHQQHLELNASHAFIFVTVNGEKQHYYKFPIGEFKYSTPPEPFRLQIGSNIFTNDGIELDLKPNGKHDDASLSMKGSVQFSNLNPWPVSMLHLGAMGPVGWLPSLECSHNVLSFDHDLSGSIQFADNDNNDDTSSNTIITLDGWKGYTEKDHGSNFPSLWIWIQSNSFENNAGTSIFFSVAKIPTMGMELPGFTAAVFHKGKLYPFTTYNGAKFKALHVTNDIVYIKVQLSDIILELTADRRTSHVLLYAPINGKSMTPAVSEALQATVHVKLYKLLSGSSNTATEIILDDTGHQTGLEVHGEVQWLVKNVCGAPNANKFLCL